MTVSRDSNIIVTINKAITKGKKKRRRLHLKKENEMISRCPGKSSVNMNGATPSSTLLFTVILPFGDPAVGQFYN